MLPRLKTLSPKTGFMSLGPYNTQTCGVDAQGNEFPRMADIYSAFTEELCPPVPVLVRQPFQFDQSSLMGPVNMGWTVCGEQEADSAE